MKAHYLGHVVFYVKDLQRSLAFYRDLLGFKEIGRVFNGTAAALTSGRTHHELLLIQVGDAPGPPQGRRRGLYHIGIKVGNNLDELRAAKSACREKRKRVAGLGDESVGQRHVERAGKCGGAADDELVVVRGRGEVDRQLGDGSCV